MIASVELPGEPDTGEATSGEEEEQIKEVLRLAAEFDGAKVTDTVDIDMQVATAAVATADTAKGVASEEELEVTPRNMLQKIVRALPLWISKRSPVELVGYALVFGVLLLSIPFLATHPVVSELKNLVASGQSAVQMMVENS